MERMRRTLIHHLYASAGIVDIQLSENRREPCGRSLRKPRTINLPVRKLNCRATEPQCLPLRSSLLSFKIPADSRKSMSVHASCLGLQCSLIHGQFHGYAQDFCVPGPFEKKLKMHSQDAVKWGTFKTFPPL